MLYILAVFIGPYMTVAAVWNIADIFNGLMAIPNLIALALLSGVVIRETKDYFRRFPKGKDAVPSVEEEPPVQQPQDLGAPPESAADRACFGCRTASASRCRGGNAPVLPLRPVRARRYPAHRARLL